MAKPGNLVGIDVDAKDVVPSLGKASTGHKPNVTGSDHGNLQTSLSRCICRHPCVNREGRHTSRLTAPVDAGKIESVVNSHRTSDGGRHTAVRSTSGTHSS